MTATPISSKDAVGLLARQKITVIDVREATELAATGTAKGGLHIALALVPLKANPKGPDFDKRIDPTKPIGVFCAVGGRAGQAVQALKALGYDAHNLGGFSDWAAAGGPVQR
jgi:rhodanese-related sulfurtransferase